MKLDPEQQAEDVAAEGKESSPSNLPRNRAERRAAMKTQLTRQQRLEWKNRKKG